MRLTLSFCITLICSGCSASVPLYAGLFMVTQGITQVQYANKRNRDMGNPEPDMSIEFRCQLPLVTQGAQPNTRTRHVKGISPYIYEDIQAYCSRRRGTVEIISEIAIQ